MRRFRLPHHSRRCLRSLVEASPLRACLSLFSGGNRSRLSAVFLLVIAVMAMVVVAPIQQVGAVTQTSDLSPENEAKSFAAYKWARNCLNGGFFSGAVGQGKGTGTINQQDANSFKWFLSGFNNVSTAGVINVASGVISGSSGDGDINCGTADGVSLMQTAVTTYWGYADGASFLCALGFTRQVGSDCESIGGTGDNAFKTPGSVMYQDIPDTSVSIDR
jgi:hypothetical protein